MKNKYAIPLAVLIILILGILNSIVDMEIEEKKEENRERYLSGYYDEPILMEQSIFTKDWDTYQVHAAFSIKIPPSMEVKDTNCIYTPNMYDYHWKRRRIKSLPIIFTQKGLTARDTSAFNTYCRIIIDLEQGRKGEFMKADEKEELSIEDIRYIQELVNVGDYKLLGKPEVCWVRIGYIYALNIEYEREGEENYHTSVNTYLLFNDSQYIIITLSYRRENECLWEKEMEAVISSFKWE